MLKSSVLRASKWEPTSGTKMEIALKDSNNGLTSCHQFYTLIVQHTRLRVRVRSIPTTLKMTGGRALHIRTQHTLRLTSWPAMKEASVGFSRYESKISVLPCSARELAIAVTASLAAPVRGLLL